jgi:hypothetical protein
MVKNKFHPSLVLLFFILAFGILAVSLGMDINWDLLNYHFYNGFAALHHRLDVDIAPAFMQTYLNPFFDVINYLFIILQHPKVSIFLLGTFSGGIAFFVFLISRLLFAELARQDAIIYVILACAIGLTGSANLSLAGTTTNDTKMTLMIVMALYFLIKGSRQDDTQAKRFSVFVAGIIGGMVIGFKMIAACYIFGLLVAVWFSNMGQFRLFLFALALGFLTVNGYWMLLLYKNFHSPFYPLYNNIFHSPLAPVFNFNLPPTTTVHLRWIDLVMLPLYMFHRNKLITELFIRDLRIGLVFLLAVICFGKSILWPDKVVKRDPAWRLLVTFFVVSYAGWLLVLQNYRYILPLEILTGFMLIYFLREYLSTVACQLVLAGLLLLMGATTIYPNWGRVPYDDKYFAVVTPTIPGNAEVIIANQPMAYLIPFFPPTVNFIGMPFVQLGIVDAESEAKPLRLLFKQVILKIQKDSFLKPLYLLRLQKIDKVGVRTVANLKRHNLVIDASQCKIFGTNVGKKYEICPLTFNPQI